MKKQILIGALAVGALGTGILGSTHPAFADNSLEACIDDVDMDVCTLEADVTISQTVNIDRDVVIDLAGHNIKSSASSHMFHIENAAVTVKGTGQITDSEATGVVYAAAFRVKGSTDPAAEDYSVLTIENGVTLNLAHMLYGAFVTNNSGHAYGSVINFGGKLNHTLDLMDGGERVTGACFYINGSVADTEGNVPVINILDNAEIVNEPGSYVYGAGYGKWNIGRASFVGASGIAMKAGVLNINGASIYADGEYVVPASYNNGVSDSGAVFQIEDNDAYADHTEIHIQDGSFISENGYVYLGFKEKAETINTLKSIEINGGSFAGKKGIFNVENTNFNHHGFIRGGSFILAENEDPADFIYPYIDFSKSYSYDEATHTVSVHDMVQADELPAGYSVEMIHADLSNMPAESKQGFATYLSKYLEVPAGFTVAQQEDITLLNSDGDPVKEEVEPITFRIRVEESSRVIPEGVTRKWYVVRSHYDDPEGEPTFKFVEASYDAAEGIITFASDQFSGFIIGYVDTELPKAPDTSIVDELTSSYIALGSLVAISAAAFVVMKARR